MTDEKKQGQTVGSKITHRRSSDHRISNDKSSDRTLSSKVIVGRTIGAKREHIETRNERALTRKKDKQKKTLRLIFTTVGFVAVIIILIIIAKSFVENNREELSTETVEPSNASYDPSIEIIDESASTTGGKITNRMKEYIGQLETDLKAYGVTPTRAVIPRDAIREVDLYLEGKNGYIKTIVDRGAGVTAEDVDRMLRYLSEQGVADFEYIDVRIDGRAFWK